MEESEGFDFGPSKGKVKLKKGGPSTPSTTWRLELCSSSDEGNSRYPVQEFLCFSSGVSARKLCANLWELQPQLHLPFPGISKNGIGTIKGKDEDDLELRLRARLASLPSGSRPDQQPGAYMGNDIQTLLTQNHRSVGRYGHVMKHPPPSSRVSFFENGRNSHVLACFLELVSRMKGMSNARSTLKKNSQGKKREPSKSSIELLRVLSKISSLEEHQPSNVAVRKTLKKGIQHSELQIKDLQDHKQKRKQGMDKLRKQVAEDKTVARSRGREQMLSAIWSDQKEIEDERTLRRQSEDLQRRLTLENSDLKSSYSLTSKEIGRERKSQIFVKNLCDEFAQEIRHYEHEVRTLRKAGVGHFGSEKPDRLVLHAAEAWLDGRMQMKLAEAQNRLAEKDNISGKLRFDVETFLQARHSTVVRRSKGLSTDRTANMYPRRESFPLHEATSAAQHVSDQESSSHGDSNCIELKKGEDEGHNAMRSQQQDSWLLNLVSDQVQLKAPMTPDRNQFSLRRMDEQREEHQRRASNHQFVLDDQLGKYSMSSEGDKIHPVCEIAEDSYVLPMDGGRASLTKNPEFDKPQASRKSFKEDVKENTLRAKLLEARLADQRAKANKKLS